MAFPGTYNINYYKGDTYEFKIYPKKTGGTVFNMSGYSVKFSMATERGSSVIVEGYSSISSDSTYVTCAITPGNGDSLTAGTQYVYDVEISKTGSEYDYIYTLLTGNITVTEQVALPVPKAVSSASFIVTEHTSTSITVTWEAPVGGPAIIGYGLFLIEDYTSSSQLPTVPNGLVAAEETLTYTYTGLTAGKVYGLGVAAYNAAGFGTPGATVYILGA